jgi:hypothetical protein
LERWLRFISVRTPPAASVAGRPPRLLAPTEETSRTGPLIVWENAPNPSQLYDVWVLPPEGPFEKVPAIYETKGVRSPVPFGRLAPPTSASGTARDLSLEAHSTDAMDRRYAEGITAW